MNGIMMLGLVTTTLIELIAATPCADAMRPMASGLPYTARGGALDIAREVVPCRSRPAPAATAMLGRALRVLRPVEGSLVVTHSVTEAEDKRLKYPHMFGRAGLLLPGKSDLLPHLRVNLSAMVNNAPSVNPMPKNVPVSTCIGEGPEAWYGWFRDELAITEAAA